jgi:hypothetical protein
MDRITSASLMETLRRDRSLAAGLAWLFLIAGLIWGFAHHAGLADRAAKGGLAFALCQPLGASGQGHDGQGHDGHEHDGPADTPLEPCPACLAGIAVLAALPPSVPPRAAELVIIQAGLPLAPPVSTPDCAHCPTRGPPTVAALLSLA